MPRHLSQHVGGFVIADAPLSELVPVENAAMPDRTIIQWDKDDLDTMNLLKVDCLALGMLTCVRKCLNMLRHQRGQDYSMATLPPEDPDTYAMIQRADTVGVFQIESTRADGHAAAASTGELLRSGGASRDRSARSYPGRHGAPVSAAA
jgi:error-prone DNA polymerase